jgi:hypothetical protein
MRFRERFEERRDELKQKHGAFWLVVAVVLIVWTIVSAWGNWDTVVAHRSFLGTLLFAAIRILTTLSTPFLALVAVVGWLGWLFFFSPVPGSVVADQSATEPTTERHDPDRDYDATLTQEVVGQGRYRVLLSGLREVGNGWDRGVRGLRDLVRCPPPNDVHGHVRVGLACARAGGVPSAPREKHSPWSRFRKPQS